MGMREHDYKHSIVPIGSFDSIQVLFSLFIFSCFEKKKKKETKKKFQKKRIFGDTGIILNHGNFRSFRTFDCLKRGVTPMWEDKANINGGRWVCILFLFFFVFFFPFSSLSFFLFLLFVFFFF